MHAGFGIAYEQFDSWGDLDVYKHFSTNFVRGMFVAVKPNAFGAMNG